MAETLSPKQAALRRIERLGDDATYEEILYAVYFLRKAVRSGADVYAGRPIAQEILRQEFEQWLSG